MKQVYVSDLNTYELKDGPAPTLQGAGDIIVKVSTTTVCGSDVHILAGHMHTPWGFPLGHEFVGVVHELSADVRNFKIGDRVVAPAAPWCGHCHNCRRGQIQACERGGILAQANTSAIWAVLRPNMYVFPLPIPVCQKYPTT